jgi:serine/threonine protein kinase
MNDDNLDQLNIIKQIGKGSFSNVYLCQGSQLGSLHLEDISMYYIIKEININSLVRKYLSQNNNSKKRYTPTTRHNNPPHQDNKTWDVNITPYRHDGIKVEDIPVSKDEYYFKRLKELVESEIDALMMFEHKNIIQLYRSRCFKGVYFLTMEYCDLGDVYQMLKSNSKSTGMDETFIIDFMKQTSIGLKYIHDRNVIHRDIKLQNILMQRTENGITFKISDFGFACYDLSKDDMKESVDIGEILGKKYFKLCGTPFYMAPEIILNMNMLENFTKFDSKGKYNSVFYSRAIDIWSYGVCVFELVYDSLPFPTIRSIVELESFFNGEGAQEYINNRINERQRLNPSIKNMLRMMLQVDPSKRYSCDQIIDYLDNIKGGSVKYSIKNTNCEGLMEEMDGNKLKKHIVEQPINNVVFESITINDSWEHVNKGDSLIMKVSVEKGFLDWLMNKK